MRRIALTVLLAGFLLTSTIGCAQGGAELDALADAFFAKDLKALMVHLPPELVKALEQASPQTQRSFAERFLFAQQAQREGVKFTRPEVGAALVVEPSVREGDEARPEKFELYLDKRISDGGETMLRFCGESAREREWDRNPVVTVWMRYVEGEWRLYEIDVHGDTVKLDDPKFLERFAAEREGSREASAVGGLRRLNTALVTYAATYPDIGAPASMTALAGDGSTSDGAGLIDSVLASGVKSGYRFTYTVMNAHEMEYSISARPVEMGVTGTRSFFTDESGVIRYTNEDREPTVADEPLQ